MVANMSHQKILVIALALAWQTHADMFGALPKLPVDPAVVASIPQPPHNVMVAARDVSEADIATEIAARTQGSHQAEADPTVAPVRPKQPQPTVASIISDASRSAAASEAALAAVSSETLGTTADAPADMENLARGVSSHLPRAPHVGEKQRIAPTQELAAVPSLHQVDGKSFEAAATDAAEEEVAALAAHAESIPKHEVEQEGKHVATDTEAAVSKIAAVSKSQLADPRTNVATTMHLASSAERARGSVSSVADDAESTAAGLQMGGASRATEDAKRLNILSKQAETAIVNKSSELEQSLARVPQRLATKTKRLEEEIRNITEEEASVARTIGEQLAGFEKLANRSLHLRGSAPAFRKDTPSTGGIGGANNAGLQSAQQLERVLKPAIHSSALASLAGRKAAKQANIALAAAFQQASPSMHTGPFSHMPSAASLKEPVQLTATQSISENFKARNPRDTPTSGVASHSTPWTWHIFACSLMSISCLALVGYQATMRKCRQDEREPLFLDGTGDDTWSAVTQTLKMADVAAE